MSALAMVQSVIRERTPLALCLHMTKVECRLGGGVCGMRVFIHVGFLAGAVLLSTAEVSAQSRCADCHFVNMRPDFASHISDWDASAHSRTAVGCEGCHGGDPSTFESFMAHRNVLPPSNPASPVHRSNIVTTCGRCHAGPFVAFQKSRHFELLKAGNPSVPTCVTCHEEAGSRLLSPRSLEAQCASCHGTGKAAARPAFPLQGRRMLEGIRNGRSLLKEANRLIARVKDTTRRARLQAMAQQVDVPLVQATQAGHAFVYDALEERLNTAQRRLAALYDDLADPPGK